MSSKSKSLNSYSKPLTEIPEESFTLPSYMYTDMEIYELEKEKIFYKTWQYVGHKSLFSEPGLKLALSAASIIDNGCSFKGIVI